MMKLVCGCDGLCDSGIPCPMGRWEHSAARPYKIAVEIEPDECGHHAVLIDVSDDSVLHVTITYPTAEDAERAAREWIDKNA